ncbi:MAG: MFS transporter [Bacteroidales bacterium]|nr:MFS transporter [Bacteroidales bacterium]
MNEINTKNSNLKTIPIFLAFLCMGFGDVVGPLVSLVKDTFDVSNFQAFFMTFSGFIMFGVLSIPIGLLQDKKGKKYIMNLGLIIAFLGLIIPVFNGMYGPTSDLTIAGENKFYILLFSILLLGAGATTLQVVGNPIMRDVSPEGRYSSNLSFAQAVKAIGSSLGFLLPPIAVQFFSLDWTLLFPVYSALILINLIWFNATGFKESKKESHFAATLSSCFMLLRNPYVLLMVLGIFLYVGAEVSMSSGVPILMKEKFGIVKFGLWVSWALFFLPILVGRFIGGLILRRLRAQLFLLMTVVLSLVGLLLLFLNMEALTFIGIIMIGLGFANIFPLIFSITVDKMPERSNELSGLMVTAIVGGAILPPIMGKVADLTSITVGFVVPLLSIIYILFVSLKIFRS